MKKFIVLLTITIMLTLTGMTLQPVDASYDWDGCTFYSSTDVGTINETPVFSFENDRSVVIKTDLGCTLNVNDFTVRKYNVNGNYYASYNGNETITSTTNDGTYKYTTISYTVLNPSVTEKTYIFSLSYGLPRILIDAGYMSFDMLETAQIDTYMVANTLEQIYNGVERPATVDDWTSDITNTSPFLWFFANEDLVTQDLYLNLLTQTDTNPSRHYNIDAIDNPLVMYQGAFIDKYFTINLRNTTELPIFNLSEVSYLIDTDIDDIYTLYNTIETNIISEGFPVPATYIINLERYDGQGYVLSTESLGYTFISNVMEDFITIDLPDKMQRGKTYEINLYVEETLYRFQDNIYWTNGNTNLSTQMQSNDEIINLEIVEGIALNNETVYITIESQNVTIPQGSKYILDVEKSEPYLYIVAPSIEERFDSMTDSFGLDSDVGRLTVALGVIIIVTIGLIIGKIPILVVFLIDSVLIVFFTFIGFIPVWVIMMVALLAGLTVFFSVKRGG